VAGKTEPYNEDKERALEAKKTMHHDRKYKGLAEWGIIVIILPSYNGGYCEH